MRRQGRSRSFLCLLPLLPLLPFLCLFPFRPLFAFSPPPLPSSSPERIALIIGHNRGDQGLQPLRYAENDAIRISQILQELGGYRRDQVFLLLAPSAQSVRHTMKTIRARLKASKGPGIFFFYYSGHAREEHFQIGHEALPFLEMMRFARELPVKIRLMIIDSCYSGAFLRAKGARRNPSIRWLAPPPVLRMSGLAILTSSGERERSYESDRIGGSLYTSALLAGLRGAADKDRDQRVSLSEIQQYVYDHTLTQSASHLVEVQRPAHHINLQGQGSFFLTYLQRAQAHLRLPSDLQGHCFLYFKNELHQEFKKPSGRPMLIALGLGPHTVQVRRPGWIGWYDFSSAKNQQHHMKPAGIRWEQVSLREQVKGAPLASPSSGIGVALHYMPISNLALNGIGLSVSFDATRYLRLALHYRLAFANEDALPYQTHHLSFRVAGGYGLGIGPFWSWFGVFLDPSLSIRSATTGALFNLGIGVGFLVNLDYHLHPQLALRIDLSSGGHFVMFDQNSFRARPFLDMGLGIVWRF